jgi:hypothetical protein
MINKSVVHGIGVPDYSSARGAPAMYISSIITTRHWITDGLRNRLVYIDQPIPNGWWKGRLCYS